MRPSKAYIASFSTTGLLIALAVLLLVVVGALMAFRDAADADRSPGTSDVIVGTAPVRVGTLSERAAARDPAVAAAPSTSGVVLTRAAPPPAVLEEPGAPLQVPVGTPVADVPAGGEPTAAPPEPARDQEEERPAEGGIELGGGVDGLVDVVSPEAGDTLAEVLEQVDGAFPWQETAPAMSPDARPAR